MGLYQHSGERVYLQDTLLGTSARLNPFRTMAALRVALQYILFDGSRQGSHKRLKSAISASRCGSSVLLGRLEPWRE